MRIDRALVLVAVTCLAFITLDHPASTRMFAWPWVLALGGATLVPALLLVLRGIDRQAPLVLPPSGWLAAILGVALTVVVSGAASPFRTSSFTWGSPLLAGVASFFLFFDWLHREAADAPRRAGALIGTITIGLGVVAVVSLTSWLWWLPNRPGAFFDARNAYPLGHANYTAGLGVLLLPLAGAAAARRQRPSRRVLAFAATVVALMLIFTSGSRGGVLALAAIAVAALAVAPLARPKKLLALCGGVVIALLVAFANPRTRAMLLPEPSAAAPNSSNVQRAAMLKAGWLMGKERPLLGWGPGTTPLAFPKFRAQLDGGAENVLQLHNAPAQIWAEFGLAGILCIGAAVVLGARGATRAPVAAIALGGYAVFALFDWQLDLPVFGFAVAALGALLAPAPTQPTRPAAARIVGGSALVIGAMITLAGGHDPTPELNVRALSLATSTDAPKIDEAISVFQASLRLNCDQEIAHFNLGWLLLVRDPAAAEHHFVAAARLVPDKGGVYFGVGLARLNQNNRRGAAQALALECLNDPAFLFSPWWSDPAIAAQRAATLRQLLEFRGVAARSLAPQSWAAAQLPQLAACIAAADTTAPSEGIVYRRQRLGYPVLMRTPDLPTPVDVFDVRDSTHPPPPCAGLPKGWLPSPLLLRLLDANISATK
jgi:O-antigen ligase